MAEETKEKRELRQAREALEAYQGAARAWLEEAHTNVLLALNAPFTKEQHAVLEAKGVPVVAIAHIHAKRRQRLSKIAARAPRFRAAPRTDGDKWVADIVSDLFAWIYQESLGDAVNEQCAGGDFDEGRGLLHIFVDPQADDGRGEIRLEALRNNEAFCDDKARHILCDDAAGWVIAKPLTREAAEQTFGARRLAKVRWMKTAAEIDSNFYSARWDDQRQRQALAGETTGAHHDIARLIIHYRKIRTTERRVTERYRSGRQTERSLSRKAWRRYRAERAFIVVSESGDVTFSISGSAVQQLSALYDEAATARGLPRLGASPNATAPEEASGAQEADFSALPVLFEAGHAVGPGGLVPQVRQVALKPTTKGALYDLSQQGVETGITVERKEVVRIARLQALGDVVLSREVLPISEYPVIPMMTYHRGSPFPVAEVTMLRPLVEQDNKINQKIIDYVTRAANLNVWLEEGAAVSDTVEDDLANPGISVHRYHAGAQPPVPHQIPPMPNEVFSLGARTKAMIDEVSGEWPRGAGDPSAAPVTLGQDLLDQERAAIMVGPQIKSLTRMWQRAGRVIQQLIPHVYTHEKVFRLVFDDGEVGPQRSINLVERGGSGEAVDLLYDITSARYDVVVVAGSTQPTLRMAKAEILQKVLETTADPALRAVLTKILFRKLDMPEIEEALREADLLGRLQQELQRLQAENQKKDGLIQRMESEIRHANRTVDRVKGQKAVEAPKQAAISAARETERALRSATADIEAVRADAAGGDATSSAPGEEALVRFFSE